MSELPAAVVSSSPQKGSLLSETVSQQLGQVSVLPFASCWYRTCILTRAQISTPMGMLTDLGNAVLRSLFCPLLHKMQQETIGVEDTGKYLLC